MVIINPSMVCAYHPLFTQEAYKAYERRRLAINEKATSNAQSQQRQQSGWPFMNKKAGGSEQQQQQQQVRRLPHDNDDVFEALNNGSIDALRRGSVPLPGF